MIPNETINNFASDNVTCACPEVMDAVVAANAGLAHSYGEDSYSTNLEAKLCEIFETQVCAFPVITGTACNALALSAITPSFGKVYCHELSHVNTDECGAPEFFTGGAKLIDMHGDNGKLNANSLQAAIYGRGNVHHAQPAAVSITQACETGVVYQRSEIAAITAVAHAHELNTHMDGARFANALVTLDISPAEMTWQSGIDVLSFGGTKNGCLAAELVIFFKAGLSRNFAFLHKRSGQLLSKMRFVSAQLQAYLSNDVWLRNARQANAMAARLSQGLATIPALEVKFPTQSNEVFVTMPDSVVQGLENKGVRVNDEELDGTAVRFVTAWNTNPTEVDQLLGVISQQCAALP